MEQCLTATAEGRSRKEREAGRREEELTTALRAEDDRITKEKELSDKAARDSATAASSTDPKPTAPEDAAPTTRHTNIDVDPSAEEDTTFVTDRTQMDIDTHDDRRSPTATRASKKFRPASEFEERAPGQRRTIPSQGGDTESKRPHVPAPSSPTISYKSDEPEDTEMEDKKILSSILRGVDITEVDSPQRVVDVCHKYQLIKGDSFDLRTGFDLSDPAVQQRVGKRIVETNA